MDKAFLLLLNGLNSPHALSENSSRRLERLVTTWDRRSWVIVSTGFTRYKPPFIDEYGFPATESRVAATELVARGVERSKILVEEISSDTIGNIYYAMLLFIQPLDIRKISIVTSAFHIPRAKAVVDWVCSLSGWRTVPSVAFDSASNAFMPEYIEALILAKEAEGHRNVLRLRQTVRSVSDMCLWMQTEHKAYRFDTQVDPLPPTLLPWF